MKLKRTGRNVKTRVYISGKISDLDFDFVEGKFAKTANELCLAGYEAVSPLDCCNSEMGWLECMIMDIRQLSTCHGIYMQKDWEQSDGAKIELAFAKKLGLWIAYE